MFISIDSEFHIFIIDIFSPADNVLTPDLQKIASKLQFLTSKFHCYKENLLIIFKKGGKT